MSRRKKNTPEPETLHRADVAEKLRGRARQLDRAADRADTLDAEDTRRRNAAQVRFVAAMVETRITPINVGEAWDNAAARMIEAYDAVDMEAVHASRSSRREGKTDDA